MSGSKYCPNCGKELESYVKICDYCGAKLDEKVIIRRSPGKPEKVVSFCLLCIGVLLLIISLSAFIYYYNQGSEVRLGMLMPIIFTNFSISFCIFPAILLYLRGKKRKTQN